MGKLKVFAAAETSDSLDERRLKLDGSNLSDYDGTGVSLSGNLPTRLRVHSVRLVFSADPGATDMHLCTESDGSGQLLAKPAQFTPTKTTSGSYTTTFDYEGIPVSLQTHTSRDLYVNVDPTNSCHLDLAEVIVGEWA